MENESLGQEDGLSILVGNNKGPVPDASPIGGIDFAVLRIENNQAPALTLRGWIIHPTDPIKLVQFGIPGNRLSCAKWIMRNDIENIPLTTTSLNNPIGFQVVISQNDRSSSLDPIYYIANLESGKTAIGYLDLPEVSIQNLRTIDIPKNNTTKNQIETNQILQEVSKEIYSNKIVEEKNDPSKNTIISYFKSQLENLLLSSACFQYKKTTQPKISIVIVVHNKAELTYQCLLSILYSDFPWFEVIVVDNDSSDETQALISRFKEIKYIKNDENLHFLKGSNQGAQYATGKSILFLNNDTILHPQALVSAFKTLMSAPTTGVVGGRLLNLDGSLQEAGCGIMEDGSCYPYGRNDNPWDFKYLFQRQVDYCSGAFLLTSRELFIKLGGFDERYQPAYYEDVDYCLKVNKQGLKVIYEPNSIVYHLEHGSGDEKNAKEAQLERRVVLKTVQANYLSKAPSHSQAIFRFGRAADDTRKRILFIDDRIPFPEIGSGFPRTKAIISALVKLNADVTYIPIHKTPAKLEDIYQVLPHTVEVLPNKMEHELEMHLKQRADFYDIIYISRPHNLELWNKLIHIIDRSKIKAKLVYDVESIYSDREFIKLENSKDLTLSNSEKEYVLSQELGLARDFDLITVVSPKDLDRVIRHGAKAASIVSYDIQPKLSIETFERRRDLLFVGPLLDKDTPNAEGLNWFVNEVFPLVLKNLGDRLKLTVVGVNQLKTKLEHPNIDFVGAIENLELFYNSHRLVIAPVKVAAGISLKTIEAAANGVPVITTETIAKIMSWDNLGQNFYSNSAEEFANHIIKYYTDNQAWQALQSLQFTKVSNDFEKEKFLIEVSKVLEL